MDASYLQHHKARALSETFTHTNTQRNTESLNIIDAEKTFTKFYTKVLTEWWSAEITWFSYFVSMVPSCVCRVCTREWRVVIYPPAILLLCFIHWCENSLFLQLFINLHRPRSQKLFSRASKSTLYHIHTTVLTRVCVLSDFCLMLFWCFSVLMDKTVQTVCISRRLGLF